MQVWYKGPRGVVPVTAGVSDLLLNRHHLHLKNKVRDADSTDHPPWWEAGQKRMYSNRGLKFLLCGTGEGAVHRTESEVLPAIFTWWAVERLYNRS